MSDSVEFEHETETTRRAAAALLRDLADGVDAGEVALDDGTTAVTAAVPESVSVELELESEDGAVELEPEIEWSDDDSLEAVNAGGGSDGADAEPAGEASPDDPDLPEILTAEDGPSGSRATFEVYRDRANEWRWRLVHDNGNIVADSGEGYARKASAINGLRSVQHNAPGADVSVED
jgi:amphi-Trp domain-containing protein